VSSVARGELMVIGVRVDALGVELRNAVTMAGLARLFAGPRRDPFYLNGPDLDWATQRLRSSLDRALGVRGRAYDRRTP
jgi:hypothetical protein